MFASQKETLTPTRVSRTVRKILEVFCLQPSATSSYVRTKYFALLPTKNVFTGSSLTHSPPRIQALCRKACSSAEGIRLACAFRFSRTITAWPSARFGTAGTDVTWRHTNTRGRPVEAFLPDKVSRRWGLRIYKIVIIPPHHVFILLTGNVGGKRWREMFSTRHSARMKHKRVKQHKTSHLVSSPARTRKALEFTGNRGVSSAPVPLSCEDRWTTAKKEKAAPTIVVSSTYHTPSLRSRRQEGKAR